MLDEYLSLYEQQASLIENWRKINKNTLCNLYIANENEASLKEAYFSAIVARYWPAMTKMYQRCSFGISEEDCYHWLIDSVLYALEHRPWLDVKSNLYKDPAGPDKVINRCLKSKRLTHYQLLNKDKRVANLNTVSIDGAEEDLGDYASDSLGLTDKMERSAIENVVDGMIFNCIEQRNYFTAILLDAMLYTDILENDTDDKKNNLTLISSRKLNKILIENSTQYIDDFLNRHPIDSNLRVDFVNFISKLTPQRISGFLDRSLSSLRTAKMRKLLYK